MVKRRKKKKIELLPCPNCGGIIIGYYDSTTPLGEHQEPAIYCSSCPLGLEEHGSSFEKLAVVWNNLPRIWVDKF